MTRSLFLASLLVVGCSSSSSSSSAAKKQLTLENDKPVTIEVQLPGDWRPDEATRFKADDARISFVAISPSGDTPKARVDKAVAMQFESPTPEGRTDLADGRVWVSRKEPGNKLHSRLFVPYADGVVMGVAYSNPANQAYVNDLRKTFETIQIVDKK